MFEVVKPWMVECSTYIWSWDFFPVILEKSSFQKNHYSTLYRFLQGLPISGAILTSVKL